MHVVLLGATLSKLVSGSPPDGFREKQVYRNNEKGELGVLFVALFPHSLLFSFFQTPHAHRPPNARPWERKVDNSRAGSPPPPGLPPLQTVCFPTWIEQVESNADSGAIRGEPYEPRPIIHGPVSNRYGSKVYFGFPSNQMGMQRRRSCRVGPSASLFAPTKTMS